MLAFAFFAATLLGGCERKIEGARFESIVAVNEDPALIGGAKPGYGRYVQIEISTPQEWNRAIEDSNGVYPEVGFCPLKPDNKLLAIGPYGIDGRSLSVSSDWGVVSESDGRKHFRVFLVPGHPMPQTKYASSFNQKPYDLKTNKQDICVLIRVPGYFDDAMTTNTVRIPANVVAKVAQSEPIPAHALGATRR